MLIVFSEMNCLENLNNLGVYPDEFYTDFDTLQKRVIYFRNAFVVFILAGGSNYSRKHILNFVDTLKERAANSADSGVLGYAVVSDSELETFDKYYRYTRYFDVVYEASRTHVGKKKLDIWSKLKSEPKKSLCYMSPFDMGGIEFIVERFMNRPRNDDVYAEKIVIPTMADTRI